MCPPKSEVPCQCPHRTSRSVTQVAKRTAALGRKRKHYLGDALGDKRPSVRHKPNPVPANKLFSVISYLRSFPRGDFLRCEIARKHFGSKRVRNSEQARGLRSGCFHLGMSDPILRMDDSHFHHFTKPSSVRSISGFGFVRFERPSLF